MKRSLPTLGGGKHARPPAAQNTLTPPAERKHVQQFVVSVAYTVHGQSPAHFAGELVRSLIAHGARVSALVSVDDDADAQAALGPLHDAGAEQVSWVHVNPADVAGSLLTALSKLSVNETGAAPDARVLVAFGNTLPLFLKPQFTVLIAGPAGATRTGRELERVADLVLNAPSDQLARELGQVLSQRVLHGAS